MDYKISKYITQAPFFTSYLSIRKRNQKIRISENFPIFLLINGYSSLNQSIIELDIMV